MPVSRESLRELLDAVVAVSSDLDLSKMLERITELACDLVDARYGALGVLDETGRRLSEFVTVGVDDETRRAIGRLPEGHGILGLLILDAQPLRLPNLSEHPDSSGFPPNHPPMESFLGVPIRVHDQVFGNLYLTQKSTAPVFSDEDEELVVGLAAAAGFAIDNAQMLERDAQRGTAADRERIARELHDTVVQRLFAIGLSLQATASMADADGGVVDRIEQAVDDLDETVTQIRSAIFELSVRRPNRSGFRGEILALCRESARTLGFLPRASFVGPVEVALDEPAWAELLATLREALSNAARHAGATSIEVSLVADSDRVTLRVDDDGVGMSSGHSNRCGHGLANMAERAAQLGGRFVAGPREPTGTSILWQVPRS